MKVKSIILNPGGKEDREDTILLCETDLPHPCGVRNSFWASYPLIKCQKGYGEEYCRVNFPGIPIKVEILFG